MNNSLDVLDVSAPHVSANERADLGVALLIPCARLISRVSSWATDSHLSEPLDLHTRIQPLTSQNQIWVNKP